MTSNEKDVENGQAPPTPHKKIKVKMMALSKGQRKGVFALAAFALVALLAIANLIGTFLIVDRVVPMSVATTESGAAVLEDKLTGQIAQVALAKQVVPLGLAAHMTDDELMSIDKVLVTKMVYDASGNASAPVKEAFTVLGYERRDAFHLSFRTAAGARIQIIKGSAFLLEPEAASKPSADAPASGDGAGDGAGDGEDEDAPLLGDDDESGVDSPTHAEEGGEEAMGLPIEICATNVECARFKVGGLDVDAIHARAKEANPQVYKRALAQAGGECTDPEPLVEAVMGAVGAGAAGAGDKLAASLLHQVEAAVQEAIAAMKDDVVTVDESGSMGRGDVMSDSQEGEANEEELTEAMFDDLEAFEASLGNATLPEEDLEEHEDPIDLEAEEADDAFWNELTDASSAQDGWKIETIAGHGDLDLSLEDGSDSGGTNEAPPSDTVNQGARRKLRARKTRKTGLSGEMVNGMFGGCDKSGMASASVYPTVSIPTAATTGACKTTKQYTDYLTNDFQKSVDAADSLATAMGRSLQPLNNVKHMRDQLYKAKSNFGTLGTMVKLIKCCGGPVKLAGSLADAAIKGIKPSVNSAYSGVNSVYDKSRRLKPKLDAAKRQIEELADKLSLADDTFTHYGINALLVADKFCSHYTQSNVCTNEVNAALRKVKNAIPRPEAFDVRLPDLSGLDDYRRRYLSKIQAISLEPVVRVLKPIYDFLNKRHCVPWWAGGWCFRIKDIFDNWLVRFISGIIDSILKPLLAPVQRLFASFGLPGLPAMPHIPISISVPSVDFARGMYLPCLGASDYRSKFADGTFWPECLPSLPKLASFQCPAEFSSLRPEWAEPEPDDNAPSSPPVISQQFGRNGDGHLSYNTYDARNPQLQVCGIDSVRNGPSSDGRSWVGYRLVYCGDTLSPWFGVQSPRSYEQHRTTVDDPYVQAEVEWRDGSGTFSYFGRFRLVTAGQKFTQWVGGVPGSPAPHQKLVSLGAGLAGVRGTYGSTLGTVAFWYYESSQGRRLLAIGDGSEAAAAEPVESEEGATLEAHDEHGRRQLASRSSKCSAGQGRPKSKAESTKRTTTANERRVCTNLGHRRKSRANWYSSSECRPSRYYSASSLSSCARACERAAKCTGYAVKTSGTRKYCYHFDAQDKCTFKADRTVTRYTVTERCVAIGRGRRLAPGDKLSICEVRFERPDEITLVLSQTVKGKVQQKFQRYSKDDITEDKLKESASLKDTVEAARDWVEKQIGEKVPQYLPRLRSCPTTDAAIQCIGQLGPFQRAAQLDNMFQFLSSNTDEELPYTFAAGLSGFPQMKDTGFEQRVWETHARGLTRQNMNAANKVDYQPAPKKPRETEPTLSACQHSTVGGTEGRLSIWGQFADDSNRLTIYAVARHDDSKSGSQYYTAYRRGTATGVLAHSWGLVK